MSTRQDILSPLEAHRGTPLSGAALAKELGISRTAVWKAINRLRSEGFMIEAGTNKGYMLLEGRDVLTAEAVTAHLHHKVPVYVYDVVDSTNKVAASMAMDRAPHGTTVIADQQTAGRGRRGRSFYSPSTTGLYMSIIVKPTFDISKAVLITAAAAVAISSAINQVSGLHTQIKWVNDIYLDGKKVSGTLTEAVSDFETGEIHRIVTGIGINCSTENFPEGTGRNPGSLGGGIRRSQLAAAVIDHFLDIIDDIESRRFIEEYRSRSMVIGRDILIYRTLDAPGEPARALDIDRDGGLIVERPDGSRETLSTGEITIRMP